MKFWIPIIGLYFMLTDYMGYTELDYFEARAIYMYQVIVIFVVLVLLKMFII